MLCVVLRVVVGPSSGASLRLNKNETSNVKSSMGYQCGRTQVPYEEDLLLDGLRANIVRGLVVVRNFLPASDNRKSIMHHRTIRRKSSHCQDPCLESWISFYIGRYTRGLIQEELELGVLLLGIESFSSGTFKEPS